jgi:co-chaperonin GroES (HSP10)
MNDLKRRIRKINPLGYRVVVQIEKDNDITDGGLYLPQGAKSELAEATLAIVIEVASATDTDTDEETNVSGIPMGARVLIQKDAGVKIPWNANLRIIDTHDVLALVDDIAIS